MNSFSSITLVGRLTRNAELKNTQSGSSVLSFGIAIDRRRKGLDGNFTEDPVFVDVSYFSSNALNICQFLEKGTLVGVVGELSMRKWVSNDGQNMSKLDVIANNVHLIESKEATELRRQRQQMPSFTREESGVVNSSDFQRSNSTFQSTTARFGYTQQTNTQNNNQNTFSNNGQNNASQAQANDGPDSFDEDADVPF